MRETREQNAPLREKCQIGAPQRVFMSRAEGLEYPELQCLQGFGAAHFPLIGNVGGD